MATTSAANRHWVGSGSVRACRYLTRSTASGRTSRLAEVGLASTATSSISSFAPRSIVNNCDFTTALDIQQPQRPPHHQLLRQHSSMATAAYDTSVEAFPSIVIGPDRSIEPQGSFAEAQAQVRFGLSMLCVQIGCPVHSRRWCYSYPPLRSPKSLTYDGPLLRAVYPTMPCHAMPFNG
jgi:hypothetical protein